MKTETGILLAGTVGVIIGLTFFGFRALISKKRKEYDDYYNDFHRNFERRDLEHSRHRTAHLAL